MVESTATRSPWPDVVVDSLIARATARGLFAAEALAVAESLTAQRATTLLIVPSAAVALSLTPLMSTVCALAVSLGAARSMMTPPGEGALGVRR